jgi:hypothetical protein
MLRKYQSVEQTEIVSPKGHQAIESELRKVGKTSVSQLDEDQRNALNERLEKTESDD